MPAPLSDRADDGRSIVLRPDHVLSGSATSAAAAPAVPLGNGLGPELADLLAEAVVWSDGPVARAEAVLQIISCVVDALSWRLEPQGCPTEEHSARSLVSAAAEHLARMRTEL